MISALGLIAADYVKIAGITRRTVLDDTAPDVLRDSFVRFRDEAAAEFHTLGLHGALAHTATADMRFLGQAFEVPVELDAATLPGLTIGELATRFTEAHRRLYGHGGEPGRRVEIVGLRFGVRRPLEAMPAFRERPVASRHPDQAPLRTAAGSIMARLVDATELLPGEAIAGPALIEGYSSTTWVPPEWRAVPDTHGNILLRREAS